MNMVIAAMIRASGRSWWQCRYTDGRVLSEWDTLTGKFLLPLGNSKSSRWEDVPKKDMVGLRILCPNGVAGELEAPEGHRFLQLKSGSVDVMMGGRGGGRTCEAHIIGVIRNDKGDCLCRAWETREQRLIQFEDNVFDMKYRQIGRLALEVQGIKL